MSATAASKSPGACAAQRVGFGCFSSRPPSLSLAWLAPPGHKPPEAAGGGVGAAPPSGDRGGPQPADASPGCPQNQASVRTRAAREGAGWLGPFQEPGQGLPCWDHTSQFSLALVRVFPSSTRPRGQVNDTGHPGSLPSPATDLLGAQWQVTSLPAASVSPLPVLSIQRVGSPGRDCLSARHLAPRRMGPPSGRTLPPPHTHTPAQPGAVRLRLVGSRSRPAFLPGSGPEGRQTHTWQNRPGQRGGGWDHP